MLQNLSKPQGFKKIMVYNSPPWRGGEKEWRNGEGINHIWLMVYNQHVGKIELMKQLSLMISRNWRFSHGLHKPLQL